MSNRSAFAKALKRRVPTCNIKWNNSANMNLTEGAQDQLEGE